MTKKYRVKTKAVIQYNPPGSIIELSEEETQRLVNKKYAEIVEEVKPVKKASAPKKPAKKPATKKADTKKDSEK